MVAFAAIASQWSAVSAGSTLIYLGLDYARARAGLELAGIAVTPEQWDNIRTMEAAAREALNSRSAEG